MLAPLFQKPLIILSGHFLTLDLFFSTTTKRMRESIVFPVKRTLCWLVCKTKRFKKIKYSRSSTSCDWGSVFLLVLIDYKGKMFKADRKKLLISLITGEPVPATTAPSWWLRRLIYFFSLFYFSFAINNARPACRDCVNNMYSFILSLLKLYGTFSFMN